MKKVATIFLLGFLGLLAVLLFLMIFSSEAPAKMVCNGVDCPTPTEPYVVPEESAPPPAKAKRPAVEKSEPKKKEVKQPTKSKKNEDRRQKKSDKKKKTKVRHGRKKPHAMLDGGCRAAAWVCEDFTCRHYCTSGQSWNN